MKKWISLAAMTMILSSGTYAGPGDSLLIADLKQHITYLSSDELKGRLPGTKGEKLAYKYITGQYRKIGIAEKGSEGYLQSFEFDSGKKPKGKNELVINTKELEIGTEYFPVNISANGKARGPVVDVGFGITAASLDYDSYRGLTDLKQKIFLMECSTPEGDNPHSKFGPYADIKTKVENAKAKGALAVIFTNTFVNAEDLKANFDIKSSEAGIPVIFIRADAWKKIKRDQLNMAELVVNLEKITVTGHNIIGFVDNHASSTIVIGAHYDHLGFNELGGSLYRGDPAIHNGADDNASGSAAVIELARWVATNDIKEKNNFLFIHFSGEEEGLIGSKYWVEHATYDTSKINFMINMDMIGRYRSEKGLEVSGLGTSPASFEFLRSLTYDTLKIKLGESGSGPSDHTSFYLANIPVLNFFTGTHEDYHKPTDDADKINYNGEASVINLIKKILQQLDSPEMLAFSRTRQTDTGDVPQFKVRMGIIPDYLYEGTGLRVDGVNEDQPAAKGGIQKGDVILSIGEYPVSDIMAYMKALAAFQKGDTVPVTVKRNEQEMQLNVTF